MAIASSDKGSTGGGSGDLAALQQLLNAGGGGSTGGQVYMGTQRTMVKTRPGAPERGFRGQDSVLGTQQAEQEYYTWDQKKQNDFVSKAIVGGLLNVGAGRIEGGSLWKSLVGEAAKYFSAGQKVSPMDLLASYVKAAGGGNSWTTAGVWKINTVTGERQYQGPGTYLGNGTAQQVDTRVDLTDPDTAKAVATKLFQDLMGRDPGAGELTNFASALHTAEQSSPVTQTTTTQYDMTTGQPISSSASSSGGVTAEGQQYIGEQQIKKSKEYGAYQAATTYQNALDSLVFGSGA